MKEDFLTIEKETKEEFERIAGVIFNKFAIVNHQSTFRIVEIEFYWNSKKHPDKSTYERKYVDPKRGEWFFHYSGVDIALKNEKTGGYGGILIRGIYDINENKKYSGPMVCAMKLFSGTSVFNESIKTKLIDYPFTESEIKTKPRKNLGENAKESGTDKLNYNFYIEPYIIQ